MKKVYRNLQKEHMKQLKSETKPAEGSGTGGGRGFIAHCLVKVVCAGADKVMAEQLKVSLLYNFYHSEIRIFEEKVQSAIHLMSTTLNCSFSFLPSFPSFPSFPPLPLPSSPFSTGGMLTVWRGCLC